MGATAAISIETFSVNAASALLYELAACDLALRRLRRDDVRRFAAKMRGKYQKMQGELGSFLSASESPMRPPKEPIALHRVLLDELESAASEQFDHRFVSQQQLAHREAITLFTSYMEHGDIPGVQNLCRLGLPILEEHARIADALARSL